jgi:hypothetical protein
MSNDMVLDAPPLKGEKFSIASRAIALESAYLDALGSWLRTVWARIGGGLPMFCGALALWAAPGLLLARFSPDELFIALANAPVRASPHNLLMLMLAVAYLVATGLLLGWAAERVVPQSRWRRAAARVAFAPMILLSLGFTAVVSVQLFLGLVVRSFPSLL